jgi:hypothetical protein
VASNHESDDEAYSVAQFQRTMNPSFRTSSPQPSTFESHNDPDSNLREEMGLPQGRTSLQGEDAFTAHARSSHGSAAPPPLATSQLGQNSSYANPYADAPTIPHNPYPTDGMTQFCRPGPPSERSSIPSPVRRGSRDSLDHSDYSQPTSLSSVDPTSGHASPTKQYNGSSVSAVSYNSCTSQGPPDEKQVTKKKSGFFQSPFRRKSQKSKEPLQSSNAPTPTGRNTWTPATSRQQSYQTSPTKQPFGKPSIANTFNRQPSTGMDADVDPRADYQLGIGNNVFEVAHPDSRKAAPGSRDHAGAELDPIARALAELKGVAKQASVRQSADRHYGMSTPVPGTPSQPAPFSNGNHRNTPPPSYDRPVSHLGAPQPAHTKRDMQKATAQYVGQKQTMFNGVPPRPASSNGQRQPPRATSPAPPRATSPRPYTNADPHIQPAYRAASPNPYGGPGSNRQRAQSSSPIKAAQPPNYSGYASRGGSPGYQVPRATSPNPAYMRPAAGGASRPQSSRGQEHGGAPMALQLAPASTGGADPYGSQRTGRPQSQYYPSGHDNGSQMGSRARSHSQGTQRQVTKDGRPILHYGTFQHIIPHVVILY